MRLVASRIKGITVEIGGDTTGLDKALSGVDKEIKSTSSNLRDVNKLLRFDPKNTALLKQKQELLGKQIDSTKDRLKKQSVNLITVTLEKTSMMLCN